LEELKKIYSFVYAETVPAINLIIFQNVGCVLQRNIGDLAPNRDVNRPEAHYRGATPLATAVEKVAVLDFISSPQSTPKPC
jgi:hypothetical protein